MSEKVNTEMGSIETKESEVKFMIYSAHDDQVTNMLTFLGSDFYFVPYAATVTFELKYSVQCLASDQSSESCFGVSIRLNGEPLLFDECTGDNFSLEGCKYPEFLSLIESRWYSGPSADDLDQACFTPVPPAPTSD